MWRGQSRTEAGVVAPFNESALVRCASWHSSSTASLTPSLPNCLAVRGRVPGSTGAPRWHLAQGGLRMAGGYPVVPATFWSSGSARAPFMLGEAGLVKGMGTGHRLGTNFWDLASSSVPRAGAVPNVPAPSASPGQLQHSGSRTRMLSSHAERWAHLHKARVKCLYDVFFRAITFTGTEDCMARRAPAAAASPAPCLEGPCCCPVPPPWPRERWQRGRGTAVPCSLVYSYRAGLLAAWGKTYLARQEKKFCETELAVMSPLQTTTTLLTERGHLSASPPF